MSKDAASLRDTFRVRAFVRSRGFGNGACGWGRLKTPTLSGGTAYRCLTLSPPQSSRDLTEWSRSVRSVFLVHENSSGLVSTNALPSRGMGFRRNLRLVHYGACGVPSPFIPLKGNKISEDLMETVNLLLRRNEGIFCCSCCTPCDADRPPRMRQWMTKRTVANAVAVVDHCPTARILVIKRGSIQIALRAVPDSMGTSLDTRESPPPLQKQTQSASEGLCT